jgi:hypothetical protein
MPLIPSLTHRPPTYQQLLDAINTQGNGNRVTAYNAPDLCPEFTGDPSVLIFTKVPINLIGGLAASSTYPLILVMYDGLFALIIGPDRGFVSVNLEQTHILRSVLNYFLAPSFTVCEYGLLRSRSMPESPTGFGFPAPEDLGGLPPEAFVSSPNWIAVHPPTGLC